MSLSFEKLDWLAFLSHLKRYISSEFVLDYKELFLPCFDRKSVEFLRERTKYFWEVLEKGQRLEFPTLKSLRSIFNKASKRGLFLPVELKDIKSWFVTIRTHYSIIKNFPYLENFDELYEEIAFIEETLDRVIDYERVEVKDRASYQLFIIRRKIKEAEALLLSRLEGIKEYYFKKGYLQENLFTQRQGRYVLPVKIEYKNKVRGILHEVSQSGATAFIEPVGIISLANELEDLRYKEEREVSKVLKEVSFEIFELAGSFFLLERIFAELEVALAKAKLGREYRGVFPEFKNEVGIKIKSGVHPILYLESRDTGKFPVANDFFVEKGLLITGPNLGGKTVSLKTIGMFVLMAQSGCLVPAKEAKLQVFKKIFVDLGDEQSIFEGESSFSSHLKNLKRVLEQADRDTLVLLDEPGKGTNPQQGAALVGAIMEELLSRNTKFVITTHSQFLKNLALKLKDVKVASMEFDEVTKEPTYRLVYGVWGESFAFELARKVGFPEKIITRAAEFLEDEEYWQWHKALEEELKKVKDLKKELEKKKEEVLREKEELSRERERLKERYEKQLEIKLQEWSKEFRKLVSKAKTASKKKEKKLLEEFNKFVEEVLREGTPEKDEAIREGDEVEVISLKAKGKVVKLKGNQAEVLVGRMKLEVPVEALKKIGEGVKEVTKVKVKTTEEEIKERVMLLGLTVDEAISEVERALNAVFLKGGKKLYVVHGHGTGKLREAIRKYLSSHPLVKAISFAEDYEGGTGVTIAYLEEKN
ncbi:MAG: hypothetical protein GXO57_07165 [Thermodesulfobacteria bacterium]|nr:hypothetical protein [Thermodesulfobacteriota bacterium]